MKYLFNEIFSRSRKNLRQINKWMLLPLLSLFWGCNHQKNDQLLDRFQELENLTVYSVDAKPAVKISFQLDAIYGDSNEVLIGRIVDVAVDRRGRVYIADIGNMVLYTFDPDGKYIERLGRDGKGPGEFNFIKSLQIRQDQLYVFDSTMHRLNIFSLDSLALSKTVSLGGNKSSYQALSRTFPEIRNLHVRDDGFLIAEFVKHATTEKTQPFQNIELLSLFYLLGDDGNISKELYEFTSAIITDLGIVYNIKEFF